MNEVYHLLSNMVKDTGSETYFLSILQHLLLIRNDYYIRPQYYKVIEECVSQVVLHRSGMDPDFGYSKRLDVDFTHLIDQCVDKAKVEESEQNAAEYSKKFDEEFSARQEAQAESQKKEEKIKELEGKIQALESQLTIEKDKLTEAQRLISESEAKIAAGPTAPGPPPPPPLPGGGAAPPTSSTTSSPTSTWWLFSPSTTSSSSPWSCWDTTTTSTGRRTSTPPATPWLWTPTPSTILWGPRRPSTPSLIACHQAALRTGGQENLQA
ncbi:hypothetical protein CesoFtcFv8_009923 [Champsocephalus esox]|uniref:Formin FH3 domain-containing protein n=1 Tax=Champsocephalus esox TaxID=159716 RepID=A0AAN8H004_9TELE|nr:hypothetical protein CesoFtcFv8_009923 [Champsocephalus esox]